MQRDIEKKQKELKAKKVSEMYFLFDYYHINRVISQLQFYVYFTKVTKAYTGTIYDGSLTKYIQNH